ncbi:ABC transporter ATP-binding protein [Mariniblastus fucicola]|uniref:ABC transporter ATP-binding protein n=1 Tax=Mariniblastus fucicola TaxID=980251 RepID=UPI001FD3036F|nr:ABC transporter ATP-binding protein [Mariniblastus fucicola]
MSKRYRDFLALDQVSLRIDDGEVFGLLGPNGAGKSTLIRCLLGFLKPSSGTATVDGLDCYLDRVSVHTKLSYLPGDARMYRTMRARSLLKMFAGLREGGSWKDAFDVADRLELDLNRWVGLMSTGMRQKLALAICLSVEAPLLILDEPTANLDPTVRGQVLELIKEAKSRGQTVIFSSHVLSEIEDVCDHVAILKSGKLAFEQSMEDLSWQHRVRATTAIRVADHVHKLDSEERPTIVQNEDRVMIETKGELSPVLKWLAEMPLRNVTVEPVGLRSVYDRIHSAKTVASDRKAEATA